MKWLSVTITDQSFIKEMNPLLSFLPAYQPSLRTFFFTFSVLHGEIGLLKECAGCCDGSFGYLRKCGCSVKVL